MNRKKIMDLVYLSNSENRCYLDGVSIEWLEQALTPPNLNDLRDEIIKDYSDYLFEFFYLEEEDRDDLKVRYNNDVFEFNIFNRGWEHLAYLIKGKMVIIIYPTLNLAHKITTYFKLLSEGENKNE